ncbi:hypothetical protein D0T90_03405 [Neisseria animalis]|uniref:Uncharacterized protein n=1 Tax=Neisseria animalis TaxID=492 RepID=A0A5P3MRG1_NEIAN|nr:hypothetical protein D0T90_03405 [Neisseria animalis]ROW32810.1 hypothetical protein CGZ60_03025 [Neisseria animalis]
MTIVTPPLNQVRQHRIMQSLMTILPKPAGARKNIEQFPRIPGQGGKPQTAQTVPQSAAMPFHTHAEQPYLIGTRCRIMGMIDVSPQNIGRIL